jgi:glycosyltransferase involved in cell wall biosynthesis
MGFLPMLTVLFATRNGSQTLPSVLETFTRLQAPPSGWKLVVVDNGSTDQTREIVASFRKKLPLTYVFEARGGKNLALNTGLEHLEGDLAVFTDDDVFPHPDWLIRLRAAADDHPEYSMFGGVVAPRWEVTPPPWITWVDKRIVFAITPGMVEGPMEVEFVFGPNMAIRAEVFTKRGIRFDASIGPRGAKYAMGSETELLLRLGRQGHEAWHVQNAVVEHFIRERQMNKAWVLERAIRFGRGRFRVSQTPDAEARPRCLGIPVGFFPWLIRKGVKRAIARLSFDEQALFFARWEFNYVFGQIIEAHAMRREPHTDSSKD